MDCGDDGNSCCSRSTPQFDLWLVNPLDQRIHIHTSLLRGHLTYTHKLWPVIVLLTLAYVWVSHWSPFLFNPPILRLKWLLSVCLSYRPSFYPRHLSSPSPHILHHLDKVCSFQALNFFPFFICWVFFKSLTSSCASSLRRCMANLIIVVIIQCSCRSHSYSKHTSHPICLSTTSPQTFSAPATSGRCFTHSCAVHTHTNTHTSLSNRLNDEGLQSCVYSFSFLLF